MKAFAERLRDSLFFVPALFIAGGVALAFVVRVLDGSTPIESSILRTSPDVTRSILATVAAATATVAAVVFSITAVTVQLAASQYSPRVLQGFLRDRFQQVVVGVVVGTFSFALTGMAAIGQSSADRDTTAWTALTATALGVVVIIGIVAFIDHVTRRIRVDDTIRRLAAETTASMRSWFVPSRPEELDSWKIPEATREQTVPAARDGWVQAITAERVVADLPPGAIARIDVRVGSHVALDDPVMTVWRSEDDAGEALPTGLDRGIQIGQTRTIGQDPGFGIRQMVDIALRALSPGINDPTTAADVVHHLVAPLRSAVLADPRHRVISGEAGRRVVLFQEPDQDDLVRDAFTEIRLASGRHPIVGRAIVEALSSLRQQVDQRDHPRRSLAVLDEQLRLAASEIMSWDLPKPDLGKIARLLRAAGIEEIADLGGSEAPGGPAANREESSGPREA